MKLGKTKRRLVCTNCSEHIGYLNDIIAESDIKTILGIKILCKGCVDNVKV